MIKKFFSLLFLMIPITCSAQFLKCKNISYIFSGHDATKYSFITTDGIVISYNKQCKVYPTYKAVMKADGWVVE